jgi:hypothetical protein
MCPARGVTRLLLSRPSPPISGTGDKYLKRNGLLGNHGFPTGAIGDFPDLPAAVPPPFLLLL